MQPERAAIWGALGAVAIEAYDLFVAIRVNGRWPGNTTDVTLASALFLWAVAAMARMLVGALTAAAFSSQLAGDAGAFGIGVGGTVVLERLIASAKTADTADVASTPAVEVVGQATDAS